MKQFLKFKCKSTFAYLDDITIYRHTREHDDNFKVFLKAAEECNLTLNEDKCVYAAKSVKLLRIIFRMGFCNQTLIASHQYLNCQLLLIAKNFSVLWVCSLIMRRGCQNFRTKLNLKLMLLNFL